MANQTVRTHKPAGPKGTTFEGLVYRESVVQRRCGHEHATSAAALVCARELRELPCNGSPYIQHCGRCWALPRSGGTGCEVVDCSCHDEPMNLGKWQPEWQLANAPSPAWQRMSTVSPEAVRLRGEPQGDAT